MHKAMLLNWKKSFVEMLSNVIRAQRHSTGLPLRPAIQGQDRLVRDEGKRDRRHQGLKARDPMRRGGARVSSCLWQLLLQVPCSKKNRMVGGKQASMKAIPKIAFASLLWYNLTPSPSLLQFQRSALPFLHILLNSFWVSRHCSTVTPIISPKAH